MRRQLNGAAKTFHNGSKMGPMAVMGGLQLAVQGPCPPHSFTAGRAASNATAVLILGPPSSCAYFPRRIDMTAAIAVQGMHSAQILPSLPVIYSLSTPSGARFDMGIAEANEESTHIVPPSRKPMTDETKF